MALGPRLDLRQSQSLVMTPQLQQAIRLLALSNVEIEAFIAEEVERNPLLEAGPDETPDVPDVPPEERAQDQDGQGQSERRLGQGDAERRRAKTRRALGFPSHFSMRFEACIEKRAAPRASED